MKKSILLIALFASIALVAFLYALQFSRNGGSDLPIQRFTRHHPPDDSNVQFEWKLANPYLLKQGDGNVFLELRLSGKNLQDPRRKPMNLVLVIDRSGSMGSENKLDQVKNAANAIIDQMLPSDRLAVVTYDDSIQTLIPSTPVEDKDALREQISALVPGGSTNLYGGLQQGYEQAHRRFQKDSVNRIILLSDGLANIGVTDPDEIASEAKAIRENGISVSSMGVGVDYNETLMANVADFSGGNYYYISRDRDMSEIFRKEWNSLQKVVGTNARATFQLADGVNVIDVAGFKWTNEGRMLKIEIPDIYSGEAKRILIQFRAPSAERKVIDLGHGIFTCTEISGSGTRLLARDFNPSVRVVNDTALVKSNMDTEVKNKVASVEASRRMEEAYRKWEVGDSTAAQGLATQAIESLRALGYTGAKQAARYEAFQAKAAAPASEIAPEAVKDVVKKQREADRAAQQSNPQ